MTSAAANSRALKVIAVANEGVKIAAANDKVFKIAQAAALTRWASVGPTRWADLA